MSSLRAVPDIEECSGRASPSQRQSNQTSGHELDTDLMFDPQVAEAYRRMSQCARRDHAIFVAASDAVRDEGLHRTCLVPLVVGGVVDILTTTGRLLYLDAHQTLSETCGVANKQDLSATDRLFSQLLLRSEMQRRMSTRELNWQLGKYLFELEQELGIRTPCLLSACYRAGIPVFSGAPQDGPIFLNMVKLRSLFGAGFRLELDIELDVLEMAALQWVVQREGPTAAWLIGGGIPRSHTLQGVSMLSQIYELDSRSFDVLVELGGGDGTNPIGQTTPAVHKDLSTVLPLLTRAVLRDLAPRPPKNLYETVDEATCELADEVRQQRELLIASLSLATR